MKFNLANLTSKLRMGFILCLLVPSLTAFGQSTNRVSREHFERARSFESAGDNRAEPEYRMAISVRRGVYPEAWGSLSYYLAKRLRFREAADSWRKYLNQRSGKSTAGDLQILSSLERAAELKVRTDTRQTVTADELIDLVHLIDRFGQRSEAISYAEQGLNLHPESVKLLLALADLIKFEQKERALELLNRAVAFQSQDASVYTGRGWYYVWVTGNLAAAEADFNRAIELSKGLNASAWQGLGDTLARIGRRNEAVDAYRKYLAVRPQSAAHHDEIIRESIKSLSQP
jgi:tetratricopeptide (TPR) repeat protein